MRFGPLYINPAIALTNFGVDNNVFNTPDQLQPQSDLTLTLSPTADWWLRMGRTWLTGKLREDLIWYQDFVDQRSANTHFNGSWLVPLNKLSFSVGGDWVDAKERPGFEIDARLHRNEQAANAVAEVRAFSKTFFGLRGERRMFDFDKTDTFLGTIPYRQLDRTTTSYAITARNQLTPLTSLTFSLGSEQDRFDFSTLRDSDSTVYEFGVRFEPEALIKGSAQIGFRDFKPLYPDELQGYSGSIADAALSYVWLESTRFGFNMTRNVEYSYDINQPYYLQTAANGQISQRIYGPLDVEARLGFARLAYTNREGVTVVDPDRVDRVRSWGVGVGYRMGRDMRVGFNIDGQRRLSNVELRGYDGLRFGFAVTYGR